MSELISHSFGNNPGFSESHSMRRPSCWGTIKPVVRSEKRAAFSVAKGEMLAYSLKKGGYPAVHALATPNIQPGGMKSCSRDEMCWRRRQWAPQ